jgi:hypothetical protein
MDLQIHRLGDSVGKRKYQDLKPPVRAGFFLFSPTNDQFSPEKSLVKTPVQIIRSLAPMGIKKEPPTKRGFSR